MLCLGPVTREETAKVMEMLTLTVGQAYHTLEEKQRTEQFHPGRCNRISSLALTGCHINFYCWWLLIFESSTNLFQDLALIPLTL